MKKIIQVLGAVAVVSGLMAATGCSVARDQQSAGSYLDDAGITAAIKAKFVEDKVVDAAAISVETMKGVVQLSGFAKSQDEKNRAGSDAKTVSGVVRVVNDIIVKP